MSLYDRIFAEGEARGLAKARAMLHEEAKDEGKRELLLALLWQRFGGVEPAITDRIHAASGDELDAIGDRMITETTAAEVVGL